MTVRWKPLVILSVLFFVVAVIGVVAMVWTWSPRSAEGILNQARASAAEGRFENADIYFKQALQIDPKNPAIHLEFADLYRDWSQSAPAEKLESLQNERIAQLVAAAKFDKSGRGPRTQLLEISLSQDVAADAVYWAREVLKVDAANPDAHYVLAVDELESRKPSIPAVKEHLKALQESQAPPCRQALIAALLARSTHDDKGFEEALSQARSISLPADASPIDRLALVQTEAIEIQTQKSRTKLEGQVKSLLQHVKQLAAAANLAPGRITRLSQVLEQTQRSLAARQPGGAQAGQPAAGDPLGDAIEVELEEIFQKGLSAKQKSDLQVYMTYAEHLRFRKDRERCLKVVNEALHQSAAALPNNFNSVMGMHAVAVEMALSKQDDSERYDKAKEHIQALLDSAEPRFQGLGHLFQGAVELERSGLIRTAAQTENRQPADPSAQARSRAKALSHLKQAATLLPTLAEAQARYGVALVLNQEQSLGRQYLQTALRMGNLEAQYQFWAAWTILQAGYPEEAAPILESLFRQLAQGMLAPELRGTLHQLSGELYQARRGPGDLERATQEFAKAAELGRPGDSVLALRQAQIDVQLGRYDEALRRIDQIRKQGQGGPGAENMAVLISEKQGKKAEARALLRQARARYPHAPELAGLAAAMLTTDGKAEEAEALLKQFLASEPENMNLSLLLAQILNESLKRPKDACELLSKVAEQSENSAPLVALTQIQLEQKDLEAAAATIAKIRGRWSESATGDILDGQLALKKGNIPSAREHFAQAIKKDPDNKVVQFWKAQLDSRTGSVDTATKTLQDLVKNRPSKEIDQGVSLMSAAQSALATIELQTGKVDDAIRRFEELKRNSETGKLNRSDRWQLITAYVAKDQWPVARRELAALLNDPKNPPTPDERVRGANLYRQQNEEAAARAQLDYVLKVSPTNARAVITRSFMHLTAQEYDQAAGMLRRAIDTVSKSIDPETKKPATPAAYFYLMLGAVEHDSPPKETSDKRAKAVLEQGLAIHPESIELAKAEYMLLSASGDTKAGLALLESKAKNDTKGTFRRLLVDVFREQRKYDKAEEQLRQLLQESPDDVNLAAALVQVISLEAAAAGAQGQTDRQRSLENEALAKIADYRKQYPDTLIFLETECDLRAREGNVDKALALTEEIDKLAPLSTTGPLLRASLFGLQGKTVEVAKAFGEALERNPNQPEIRLLLGQELLKQGNAEAALKQTQIVLGARKDRPDALLLQARALAATGTTDASKEANRQSAVALLEKVIALEPTYVEAYHVLADTEQTRGRRPAAFDALSRDLKANPQDGEAVARLIQLLAGPGPQGQPASPGDLEQAKNLAADIAKRDKEGSLILAVGVGFHKAGQLDLALPPSMKAAEKLHNVVARLNLGDLLLSMAESQKNPARSRPLFERAIGEYDLVLALQPDQVEAINNKAWILHTYLGHSQQAMELAEGLVKRANPNSLPGEFYDTLGAIQEALGRRNDAERSYQSGLAKAPDHPVLNYHYGKMLASDRNRTHRAKTCLAKALAGRQLLSPAMAQDAEGLVQRLSQSYKGN
ncbi:MAG: tetratricopeptide repeat protein [Isosphaeraceae bacterium]